MLQKTSNPLLFETKDPVVDVAKIESPTVLFRKRNIKREIKDARRAASAREAIAGFTKGMELYGFTKGQFSLIDLYRAIIEITGPVHLSVSTWTAAHQDVTFVMDFLKERRLLSARWLVDLTFQNRSPALANQIRTMFGIDAIRVARNHAKFGLLQNDEWQVVVQTSMNLNTNPRFENFNVADDPEMAQFLGKILDEIWKRQPRELAGQRPADIKRHFADEL